MDATLNPPIEMRITRRRPALWSQDIIGWALLLPSVILLVVGLIIPILGFLREGVSNAEIPESLPRTVAVIRQWDGNGLPPSSTFATAVEDLTEAQAHGTIGALARRMNFLETGFRTLFMKSGNMISQQKINGDEDAKAALIAIDKRWGEPDVWLRIKTESGHFTNSYYLNAVDMEKTPAGDIVSVPPDRKLFVDLFFRTFYISFVVTAITLLLGYPAAHLLANAPKKWTPILLVAVLLPFWTSMLVRTTGWIVLLQDEGLINKALRAMGIIDGSLPLFHNRFAVVIAMVHVLLPYMILPLYASMKEIPPQFMRAASSLGANPLRAFVRVYLPQTIRGAAAGSILVFILALGYYVTPQLVGGPADQMVSQFIAIYTNQSLNWGLASSLGTILLVITLALYLVFARLSGGKAGL